MGRVVRSVSFNLKDSYEKELYEYITSQSKYFSKHIKLLIDRDKSGVTVQPVVSAPEVVEESKPVKFGKSDIKRFL